MLEEALYSLLAASATRVYPQRLPQDASLPAVVYTRISGGGEYTLTGEIDSYYSTWQLSVWASTYTAALTLAATIRAALTAYSGGVLRHIAILDESDLYDWTEKMDVAARFGRRMDIGIWSDGH